MNILYRGIPFFVIDRAIEVGRVQNIGRRRGHPCHDMTGMQVVRRTAFLAPSSVFQKSTTSRLSFRPAGQGELPPLFPPSLPISLSSLRHIARRLLPLLPPPPPFPLLCCLRPQLRRPRRRAALAWPPCRVSHVGALNFRAYETVRNPSWALFTKRRGGEAAAAGERG